LSAAPQYHFESGETSKLELKARVISGFAWTTAAIISVRLLAFLLNLILADLLAREVFAVIALANIVIGAMDLFSNFGFNRALIYYRGEIKKAADVALTLRLGQGLFLLLIAIISAAKFADYYHAPILKYVVPALGLNFIISAAWSIPMSLMDKELQFKKQLSAQTIPALLQFIVAITLALLDFSVWSIVAGMLALNISQSLLFWMVSKYKFKFAYDKNIASELLKFGLPIFTSSFIWYLVNYSPNAVIGALFSKDDLAAYSFAFTIISLPITEIIYNILNRVLFPTYSQLSQDLPELRSAYQKSLRYIIMISLPLSVGIPLFGGHLFKALYGDKWVAAIAPLQAFGLYAFMRSIAASAGNIFLALGKTKYLLINAAVCCSIIIVLIYPVAGKYGITGVAALFSFAWTFTLVHFLYCLNKTIGVGAKDLLAFSIRPAAAVFISMIPLKLILVTFFNPNSIFILAGTTILIIALFLLLMTRLDHQFRQSLNQSWRSRKIVLL